VPLLKPDEILRYLAAKGFLSEAESRMVAERWRDEKDGPLLIYLGRQKLLPAEVVEDLTDLLGDNRLQGLEPLLPGLILLRQVGRGGRGSVYRAWQPSLKRVVAVKILSRALSENREFVQRFLREARVASKSQHRNVVRAYDINKKGASVYMVMEYVSGVSLGQILRAKGSLDIPEALEVGRAVAEAIGYIARVGLVHRDIKPDNVMLDRRGGVKLCDLGLARQSGAATLTEPMTAQGTPAYMAPEAALRPEIDTQADVYALGILLYQTLLGRLPFDNPDPVEVLRMQVEEEPRGLDGGELPGALADLIRRMLEKDPLKRPKATELANEIASLQRALPGMGHARLWELVPGGEAADEKLSFDDSPPPADLGQGPVPKPWELPNERPLPESTRPRRPITGVGIGTLGVALLVAVIYILVMTLSTPSGLPEDPRIPVLEARISQLETDLATEQRMRRALAALLRESADRLILEDEQDRRDNAHQPRRHTVTDILDELRLMGDSLKLHELEVND
jgi:serine/threonine protein kinase